MGIVFAVRGDSLDARYSSNGKTPAKLGDAAITVFSEVNSTVAGINGSTTIDMAGSTANLRGLVWPGYTNTPNTRARSVLLRARFPSLATNYPLFSIGSNFDLPINTYEGVLLSNGEIYAQVANEFGQQSNQTTTGAGITTDTFYDLGFSWDGTTGAGKFNIYVDGVNRFSGAVSRDLPTWDDNTRRAVNAIRLGNMDFARFCEMYVDEFVIWDEEIDFTSSSFVLESGAGSLNGASRASYLAVDAFDGANNTFPTEAQVENGVTWVQAGVNKTGTLATATLPAENDVRLGVQYGQAGALKTGALNTNTSNAYAVEVQSNEIEVKVKSNG